LVEDTSSYGETIRIVSLLVSKIFEEYNDATTLQQRLQQLAHNITMRVQRAQMAQRAQQ